MSAIPAARQPVPGSGRPKSPPFRRSEPAELCPTRAAEWRAEEEDLDREQESDEAEADEGSEAEAPASQRRSRGGVKRRPRGPPWAAGGSYAQAGGQGRGGQGRDGGGRGGRAAGARPSCGPTAVSVIGAGGGVGALRATGADMPRVGRLPYAQSEAQSHFWPAKGRRLEGFKILVQEMPASITKDQITAWMGRKSCPAPCDMQVTWSTLTGRKQMALTFRSDQEALAAQRSLRGSDLEAGAKPTQTRWWRCDDGV